MLRPMREDIAAKGPTVTRLSEMTSFLAHAALQG